ncbi:MAG: altronate dehydratase [Halanaerobiaceae bacterium]|jgi:altronate hydrolase|nr:altronate dehydratase [Halanaerobiaceae bacterium]
MKDILFKINKKDNVAVLLKDIKSGSRISFAGNIIKIRDDIPAGHKVALRDIKKDEKVIKYGYPIGRALRDIRTGAWVHTHNLVTALKEREDYSFNFYAEEMEMDKEIPAFKGFRRKDGQIGIRNEIWLIPTVGCINKAVEKMALMAREKYREMVESGRIGGFVAFPHPYGCSQLGDDLSNTRKILKGLVKHPNAAAVLVAGLGCENNVLEEFREFLGEFDGERVRFLKLQEVEDDIDAGLQELGHLVDYALNCREEPVPVSELKIGLKCGGSDGFSGITANPLLGELSNRLVKAGAAVILTEVPEMFGAEQLLMNRAENEGVFTELVELFNGFKDYFLSHQQAVYENPSPGNKEGGITTLEEKSLGCIQKGGNVIVRGVNRYGEQIQGKGLQLLESPGNDLVSATALAAAGAQLILFSTGRGTPFGAPVPTVKISTNTALYERKREWIDFDAGQLLEGKSMEELTDELFDFVIKLASREIRSRNEENGYREIAIFKKGVTL